MLRAIAGDKPGVLWTVQVDPAGEHVATWDEPESPFSQVNGNC